MSNRDIGLEILDGLNEIRNFKQGKVSLKVRTLQDWEQGRRHPQGPAVALLRIAEQHPEVFADLH